LFVYHGRVHRATAGLILCAALWGSVFIGVHELLPVLDPAQIMTLRFGIVALAFAVALAVRPDWRPRVQRREWPLIVAAGLAAVPISQWTLIEGQRYLAPPIAALVTTFAPAVAAVLAASVHRERIPGRAVAGFAIALAGVAMIVVLGAGSGAAAGASNPLRAALALISPVSWAVYTLLSKPLAERHHTSGIVGVMMIAGSIALLPFVPHALAGAGELSTGGWGWLVFIALGGSAGPYLLWSASLKLMSVSRTAAFMYLVPVFALLWTGLLLGDPPTAIALGGGVVVLAGVALTQTRARVRV
jgi:drug/metabolite transporter (DMT)-like permease